MRQRSSLTSSETSWDRSACASAWTRLASASRKANSARPARREAGQFRVGDMLHGAIFQDRTPELSEILIHIWRLQPS